jgi:phosphatidylserine decarboxylase
MPVSGVNCLLLECVCWDKDRFGKDYLGEFDLALEDIFYNEHTAQEPRWYPLKSKRTNGKKTSNVSGEVLLQFTLLDSSNPTATDQQILEKFKTICGSDIGELIPETATKRTSRASAADEVPEEEEEDQFYEDEEPSDETDDPAKPDSVEKRKRRLRLKGLRRKKQLGAYEFSGGSDLVGIVFLDIQKITDLPPERNMTRTSFDMDPFVVASLGKKTYRTRVIRHNLNPVFNEKMIFQVLRREETYSLSFTIIDRDKLSGNDFIASAVLPLTDITDTALEADPDTGLYALKDPPDASALPSQPNKSRFKLPLSRSASSQNLKMSRSTASAKSSGTNLSTVQASDSGSTTPAPTSAPTSTPGALQPGDNIPPPNAVDDTEVSNERGDPDLHPFVIPLKLKNAEKWEEKHSPMLFIKAKYVPYPALRQQFWRAMLKQYDTDESGRISKVELTTMLDTLGSTLRESTIEGFFKRFHDPTVHGDEPNSDLTIDQAVICLEDQLFAARSRQPSVVSERVKVSGTAPAKSPVPQQPEGAGGQTSTPPSPPTAAESSTSASSGNVTLVDPSQIGAELQTVENPEAPAEEGEFDRDDLNDKDEEHVVEIRECPICHQPRLNKRSDADIITHIATCASQDWRQVNNIVMAGFVTSSQAQRKWYSKVITKISYGGYKLGANSANILVQDRITGQINEERMSVYVRLGIRLLYKGLKSKDMETKRSMWGSFDLSYPV